jgi:hypothetical protein
MVFQNHVCWQKGRVFNVMNPDAEHVQNDVFLAVHSDHELSLMDPNPANRGEANARWHIDAREFLKRFLDPNKHHVQAVVQGESGSGKSHFIKWMSLNIHSSENTYVLVIPKAGMSLRKIVERIIEVLPKDRQQNYTQKLQHIGSHFSTREQRRGSLLDSIAQSIKSDSRLNTSEPISEEEETLITDLPNIFYDPYLRTYLDKKGGIIDELVEHIFEAPQNYERLENQRLFTIEDLPLKISEIHKMAENTRPVFKQLTMYPEDVSLALRIINRNLNRAIPLVLNFSGDELIELMLDMRRSLKKIKKNLVLLIEDFARLQGIDGALLQALIEAASDTNGLCDIRWAMAITRGYYEPIAKTVQTRKEFLVDMDLSTSGENRIVDDDFIISFAARYLNTVRLPTLVLQSWYENRLSSKDGTDVPNACDSCLFRTTCHGAFGISEGFGLYPFTRNAILNMIRRKDSHIDDRFNPRILIKEVLSEVIGNYGHALEEGRFPPDQLLQVMGGSKLSPLFEDNLKKQNPELFLRRRAILELWGRQPGIPMDLPSVMYEALAVEAPKLEVVDIEPIVESNSSTHTHTVDTRTEAIRNWGRGGKLIEGVAQELREPIYEMLETYINWDAEGLERVKFARKTDGPFRTRYIIFRDQQTLPPPGATVSLTIPLNPKDDDDRRQSAIALEGLFHFRQNRNWNFPGGFDAFLALSDCLEKWSANLTKQFHELPTIQSHPKIVDVAVEVLAVGATLAGRPVKAEATMPDYFNALFEEWPEPDAIMVQTKEWKDLYKQIYSRREIAISIIRAWASGTKGGQAGALIDPGVILPALRKIRRGWKATADIKDILKRSDDYGKLAFNYDQIQKGLESAVKIEFNRKIQWLQYIRKNIPEGVTKNDLVKELGELHQLVNECGISCDPATMRLFVEALEDFRKVQLDDAIKTVETLTRSESVLQVLPNLARDRANNAINTSQRFFPLAEDFIDEVEAGVQLTEGNLDSEQMSVMQDQALIGSSLEKLKAALAVFNDGGQNAD